MEHVHKNKSGFTLIEVIVVIMVAGIAAAMLAPFIGSALTSGHKPFDNLRHAAALSAEMAMVTAKYKDDPPDDPDSMNTFSDTVETLIVDSDVAEVDVNKLIDFDPVGENEYEQVDCSDAEDLDCVLKVRLKSLANPGETVTALYPYKRALASNGSGPGNGTDDEIAIVFSDHDIDSVPGTGEIEDDTEADGYTYDGDNLVLYDDGGNPLVTITSTNSELRYSTNFGSLGTGYDGSGPARNRDAWIATGDSIDFFLEEWSYTALTLDFRNLSEGDTAEIQLFFDGDPVGTHFIDEHDLVDSSAHISSTEPFDSFTVTAVTGTFGITGFSVE